MGKGGKGGRKCKKVVLIKVVLKGSGGGTFFLYRSEKGGCVAKKKHVHIKKGCKD